MPRFRVSRAGDTVRIEFDDGGMNLLSSDALRELASVIPEDAKVLLFASARPSLFAAGADMAEMQRFTGLEAEAFARLGQELFDRIERLPAVCVALIDGDCFGGALDLALAFDLRFATPRSRFAHPGSRIGIVTGFGGTTRWRKVLSRPAANQLFLANRVLGADEALRLGLVDRVAESHDNEITRLQSLDPAVVNMVNELTNFRDSLSRREIALLAARLGSLYRM